jgi:hypothetical protein
LFQRIVGDTRAPESKLPFTNKSLDISQSSDDCACALEVAAKALTTRTGKQLNVNFKYSTVRQGLSVRCSRRFIA